MNISQIQNKFYKIIEERILEEKKLDKFINDWLNGNLELDSKQIENIIDNKTSYIEKLKTDEAKMWFTYQNALLEEQKLHNSERAIKHKFNASPDQLIINNGILSKNVENSYLIGRKKTKEELEQEKQNLISIIKSRVMRKEITFAQASKLLADINIVYNLENIESKTK